MKQFLSELKRRNVLRVAAFYAAAGWLLVQIATQVLPVFEVPAWTMRVVVVAVTLGFPFALIFAWFYELTPEGLKLESKIDPAESIKRGTGRKLDRVIIALLAAAVVVLLANQFVPHRNRADALAKAIAVLPLVNDTGDSNDEYFADGLSEELISALSQIKDLKVIGRTSSFHFKNTKEGSKAIGVALGVGYLLEGSVRKSAGRARISVNLVRAADGVNMWSQIYDRALPDIFAVQAEIAQSVAGALKVALLGAPAKNPDAPSNQNVDAYTAYLQGRFHEQLYTAADLRKAIEFYETAIRSDPHYALAYAALSRSWWALGDTTGDDVAEANRKARAAAERAVAEDPNSAEGHAALGQILVSVDRNAKGAEAEYRRALELDPASAEPKIGLSSVIANFGQIEEAVVLLQQAVQLEPLTTNAHFDLARLLTSLGRYDEAVRSVNKAIQLQPGGAGTWEMLALVEAKRGDGEAALRAAMQESDPDWRAYAIALAQQARGDAKAADEALNALIAGHSNDMSFQIATVYAFRGDADKTFEWLEQAYKKQDPGVMAIVDNPFTRELRSDPRFGAFCKKIGVPFPP
ncbi:MAG TPA: tetratricopeptide repeat protein [Bryobacteraceae bacterium]|nr:tetratricopeptide repeat protein [Bryobacteraceae bacterium]